MRLVRFAAPLAGLIPALIGACKCAGAKRVPPATVATSSATPLARAATDGGPRWVSDAPIFSAPIGATRVGHVDVVAGLVVAEGTVRVTGLTDGATAWTVDALRDVGWAPDAELRLQPVADGVTLMWRGLRGGKPARTLVLLGPTGQPRGEPLEIGSTFCCTEDGLAWIGSRKSGPTRVYARRWSDPEAREVLTLSPDREPALVCGDHAVIVLGDGDDDLTASMFAPGDPVAGASTVASRDSDFTDDEREHDAYSIGDDLGLVRVGASGTVAMREVSRGGSSGPWRRIKRALSPDDDIVTVDGDNTATLLVVTHESEGACAEPGLASESVRAIRVDRKTGEESVLELASADCDHSRGPFWIALAPGGPVVVWVERRTSSPPRSAPIARLAYRVLDPEGMRVGAIEQPADAFVGGGCDERDCSAAALVREPGDDGTHPAVIRVFSYP
jgi:hypothetical protein